MLSVPAATLRSWATARLVAGLAPRAGTLVAPVARLSDAPRKVGVRYADFRSDTVTRPTAEMALASMDAPLGDDVFGEDPTTNELEREAAELFGKEAAVFVPSGTMGNLISVGVHCARGEEAVLGLESHIFRYEAGGSAALLGVPVFPVANNPDGTLPLQALADAIKPDDPHYPVTRLVCLENSQNRCGGAALPLEYIADVAAFCREHGLGLHVDGARLLNAAVAVGASPAATLEGVDSASICMSKALGAPVGSIVVGTADFVARARRLRKMLGGGMRQAGVIAAPCRVALEGYAGLLATDHTNARTLARGVHSTPHLQVVGGVQSVHTNIVYFTIDDDTEVDADALAAALQSDHNVLLGVYGPRRLRAVTHHQVNADDVEKTLSALATALE